MNRFYEDIIKPVFEMENVKNVVEIGAKLGENTAKLICYANNCGGKVYSVDPCPDFPADKWERENKDHFIMLRDLSLNVIKDIRDADVFLIDGDHNWYTVYNELCEIAKIYSSEKFPLVMFHDIGWPYDRRDLYYSPETIPEEYRHPYERKAMRPDSDSLVEPGQGINESFFNAVEYNTPRNGVRTAVEDFVEDYPQLELEFYMLDALHGLGMIARKNNHPKAVEYFTSALALERVVRLGEKDRIKELINKKALKRTLDELTPRKIEAKLYPSYSGKEYSEDTAVVFGKYDLCSESFYGEITFDKAPDKVRFDPVGGQFCVADTVKVVTEKGAIDISRHNGTEFEGFYLFNHFDPQFVFENPKKARSFRIKANIHTFVSMTEFEMTEKSIQAVKEREDEIKHQAKELGRQNEEISRQSEEIGKLDGELRAAVEQLQDLEVIRKEKIQLEAGIAALETKERELEATNRAVEAHLQKLKEQSASQARKISELEKQVAKGKAAENLYRREANKHVNSVRYRIGTAMVDAVHSPKAFFSLPAKLISIYRGRGNAPEKPSDNTATVSAALSASKPTKPNLSNQNKAISPMFTKEQILRDNKNMMTDYSVKGNPLVSIIIINHNGEKNLTTLFESFRNCNFYRNYEVIIVDNASTDDSINLIAKHKEEFNITLIKNKENESFSKANNQGMVQAKGEYVCFLNNDIEVTDWWLDNLLHTVETQPNCGAVGARLIYPEVPDDCINAGKSFTIQHMGIYYTHSSFENEYFIRPVNGGNGGMPLVSLMESVEPYAVSSVTAACMLMKKSVAEEVDCFDEQFVYGYEDCDLSLKLFRKGYINYVCPLALLFHYEFGTQNTSVKTEVVSRRTNNIHHFKEKWQEYLKEMIWKDKLSGTSYFTNIPLTVAVVVTDDNPAASAGDYFTGLELCRALEKKGCKTKFLSMKKNCYDVGVDTDVLISLLEKYDVSNITNASDRLVTIGWARNWFDRWCQKSYIGNYTYIFASSKTACDYMKKKLGRAVELFPIAANANIFRSENVLSPEEREKFESDYVFTGSYWNDPREIIDIINPGDLPYKFKIFGANWDKVEKFAKYNAGFANYSEMPKIYAGTRIVVDDANRVTKPYGAVNSRVFDALAAGKLVITNGGLGAQETFEGMLPSFDSTKKFNALIEKYMTNEKAYQKKVHELRKFVLENHTYDIRAEQLLDFLKTEKLLDNKKIAILAPVPKWEERNAWGDFHFAEAMKKCFEQAGYNVEIRLLPQWKDDFDGKYVIVLRGLSVYEPQNQHVNIMWNISHPDKVTIDEYNLYDCVYISSEKWAAEIGAKASTLVKPLLQCTDPSVFGKEQKSARKKKYELLFVGNSRKVMRKIIGDVIPSEYDLSVYGSNWEGLIDKKYIKGQSIPNSELWQEYADACILLNDHWDDMREKGFVSNRLFDGLAAGAFIISDEMEEIDRLFEGAVVTYKEKKDLKKRIRQYMNDPNKRRELSERGRKLVLEKHTFKNRMDTVREFIEEHKRVNV